MILTNPTYETRSDPESDLCFKNYDTDMESENALSVFALPLVAKN